MDTFGRKFGQLVREKRGNEQWSQDELAARTGLTKARLSELENGKVKNPHVKTVDAICVALNISSQERIQCQTRPLTTLPSLLLENLALRFGASNPEATEDSLADFLRKKACEYQEMKHRLTSIDTMSQQIALFIASAKIALEQGDFDAADTCFANAESIQLSAATLPALNMQYSFAFERGNAALLAGEVAKAAHYWEQASKYYHSFDTSAEAVKRQEHCMRLREYSYRYRSALALHEAERMVQTNLLFWNVDSNLDCWCKAVIALGGIYWRLSQFDDTSKFDMHLAKAKSCYEDVHKQTSQTLLPFYHAQASTNLANIYSDLSTISESERYDNLKISLHFQRTTFPLIKKISQPEMWGVLQHNMGLTYIQLFEAGGCLSIQEINNAVEHVEASFEVRSAEETLQYWIASCRSLGEALIKRALCSTNTQAVQDLKKAYDVLNEALSKISEEEHPNQYEELQKQLELHLKCQIGLSAIAINY